jgi:ABC-type sugar transport system substrate-binding protein
MNGNSHTIKRLIIGLVLATALAALAIPSALAGNTSRYGPLDPWALKYFASHTTTTPAVIDGRSPDTRDAAQAAQASLLILADGRSPDTQDAAQTAQANLLTPVDGRAPDTIDAATQAHIPVVTVIQQPGFQWGDFGIGVAAAFGLICLVAIPSRLLTAHKSRKQPGSVATA